MDRVEASNKPEDFCADAWSGRSLLSIAAQDAVIGAVATSWTSGGVLAGVISGAAIGGAVWALTGAACEAPKYLPELHLFGR